MLHSDLSAITAFFQKRKLFIVGWVLVLFTVFCLPVAHAVGAAPQVAADVGYSHLDVILLIFYVGMALVFSFTCSVAESVLLSITPSYIADLKDSQPKRAELLKQLKQDKVDQSLAAILTLNTIAHTVGAIGAGAKATLVFGSAWFGVFSAAMTLMILVLTEIIPKTIGAVYWRKLSGVMAYYVKGLIFILYPLIWLMEKLTKLLVAGKNEHSFSRREFAALASIGEESGHIDPLESRIIRNLLAFGAIKAEDIMTPRSVIVAFAKDSTVAQALLERPQLSFSRIPIYQEDLDTITGFVLKTDLLLAKANRETDKKLHQFERNMTFVFSKMKLFDLLDLMLKNRIHIVLVVGEYGETKGLVTLEDVLETLLGLEIIDEIDKVEDMQALAKQLMSKRAQRLGFNLETTPDDNNADKPEVTKITTQKDDTNKKM